MPQLDYFSKWLDRFQEAQREGLEDCELLLRLRDALERRGLDRAAAEKELWAVARPAVRGVEDYTRSWDDLEAVRRAAIDRISPRRPRRGRPAEDLYTDGRPARAIASSFGSYSRSRSLPEK